MKSRVGLCALGLLMLVGALGCGGDSSPPDEKPGDAVKQAGAPTSVTVTAGDGQAAVSWTPPADNGGSAITGYTVHVFTNGVVRKSVKSSAAATTVTELTNGAAYTFAVAAINSLGDGLFSAPSAPVTPRTVPGAPRDITTTPGDRQVELAWQAPAEPGMPITGYSVTVLQGETVVKTEQVTGLRATITGLTNGTTYSFTINATNAVIGGAASAPVVATPRTVPGAPQVRTFHHGMGRIRLEWTLVDDGGSPVTRYTVTVRSGETVRTLETTAQPFWVEELVNGTQYTFTVTAHNVAGAGVSSEPVLGTPISNASAALDVEGVGSSGRNEPFAACSWKPPTNDNGSPVFAYRVILWQVVPTRKVITSFETAELSARIETGLTPGNSYQCSIQARNDAGYGAEADSRSFLVFILPDAVASFTATPGNGSVNVSWTPPTFDGGDAIYQYVITVEPGGRVIDVNDRSLTSWDIDGLTNGTTYTFSIIGRNGGGDSPSRTVQATPSAE